MVKEIDETTQERRRKELEENPILQKILKYKEEQGISADEIYRTTDIPWSPTTIRKYVKEAIALGITTEKKIKEAENKRKREKEKEKLEKIEREKEGREERKRKKEQQEKDRERKRKERKANSKKSSKEKQEERRKELENNPILQEILNYKRQGMSDYKISKMPNVPWLEPAIRRYVEEATDLGLITPEKISEAREQRKAENGRKGKETEKQRKAEEERKKKQKNKEKQKMEERKKKQKAILQEKQI